METAFWDGYLNVSTAAKFSDGDKEDVADLLSFVSTSYQLEVPLIDTSSPNIKRRLGGGTSSTVHLFRLGHKQDFITGKTKKVSHIEAGKDIAIKIPTTLEERRSMLNELRILSHPPLREHQNITDIMGLSVQTDRWSVDPLLIVEASSFGDLSKFLLGGMPHSVEQSVLISIDIVAGVQALHNSQVIHGDIKSCNILLFVDPKDERKLLKAKLCDFGFSIIVSDYPKTQVRISLPRSIPYNAPECISTADILVSEAYQADIFSLGMVLWDVWTHGFVSKNDASEIESKKQSNEWQKGVRQSINIEAGLDQSTEAVLWGILSECLEINPQQRVKEVLKLLLRLHTIASSTNAVKRDSITGSLPMNMDIVTESTQPETLPRLGYILADGDELIRSTFTCGRRVKSTILTDLNARVTSSRSLQLFAIHYLLSFCYLTGFGTEIDLALAVDHMAKSAIAGSVKALAMLPRYCRTLAIKFPAELLGLSEYEAQASTAAVGYPRPPSQISLSFSNETDISDPKISTIESDKLIRRLFEDKLKNREIASLSVIQKHQQRMTELKSIIYRDGHDVQVTDNDGNSALHHACFFGNVNETLRLLERGAKQVRNNKGITPLHWLCQFPISSTELILNSLLEHDPDVNAVSVGAGMASLHPAEWFPPGTPLSWAVFAKRADVVLLTLSHGADPLLPDFKSALEVAANYHEYEILEILLNSILPSRPHTGRRDSRRTLLELAIESTSLTDRIVRHGENYQRKADLTICLLIERSIDVSFDASTALRYSITCVHSESNVDIMQCLLKNGSDNPAVLELEPPLEDGLTPAHVAMAASGRAMFDMLIRYGADVNHATGIRKYTCLHGCSRADDEDAIYFARMLLETYGAQGVELEARDIDGCTSFMLACVFQRTELAKYLLNKGADAYALDNDGYTIVSSCLSRTAFSSLREIIPDLAEHDYICHPGMGVTALHHVAEWDEVANAETLPLLSEIIHVAPHIVNIVTKLDGRTALFSAVRRVNVQMTKILLENGAYLSIRDMSGMTAFELASGMHFIATENGHKSQIVKLATICSMFQSHTAAGEDIERLVSIGIAS